MGTWWKAIGAIRKLLRIFAPRHMGPLAIILLMVFATAVVAPLLETIRVFWRTRLLALVPLAAFLWLASFLPGVAAGDVHQEAYPWVYGLGFDLVFRLDGLALLFALLIAGIGTLIVLYGGTYLKRYPALPRFFTFLFMFMGSMLGVVLADNIFALFVFWELTSLSSSLLIGFRHGHRPTRKAALQALLVTATGGLALMAGLILATTAQGSAVISDWEPGGEALMTSYYLVPMLILVLLGAFTKSAQWPFHFWLPNAMAAPTPVSAYLHSATMVKAGVYLLARLSPHFGAVPGWNEALLAFGGITMLLGVLWALVQTDLKKMLAYTTISALGLLVMALGMGTEAAVHGALVFLLAHACYKGALFMVAGNVDHGTGIRHVGRLGGLFGSMRYTGIAAVLAAFSMAGFPLFVGFLGKELFYESALHHPLFSLVLVSALFLTGVAFAALALVIGHKLFFGKGKLIERVPHEVQGGMLAGPLVLGMAGLLFGVLPGFTLEGLLSRAATVVMPNAGGMDLHLWHGFTPVLGLSVLTLLMGLVLYRFTAAIRWRSTWAKVAGRVGPEAFYDGSWERITMFSRHFSAFIQSGHLRYYIMVILVTLFVLALLPIWHYGLFHPEHTFAGVDAYEWLLALVLVVSVLATVAAPDRLMAIAVLGVVGYGVALFFAIYGGTDMAMTQFLVETLTLIVFVYVLWKLPNYIKLTGGGHRFRDVTIAVTGGVVMTSIILLVTDYPLVSELKLYYAQQSYLLAKGRNVVNVILVDFRALDTMGEIAVLSIAGLGVMALAKLRLGKQPAKPRPIIGPQRPKP
jgi:multicomponent Na+:H+ antiporter subunit A